MGFLSHIFKNKSTEQPEVVNSAEQPVVARVDSRIDIDDAWRYNQLLSQIDQLVKPRVANSNFLELFRTVPEVFWPIHYIAKRISEAHYDLKRVKDDSIVWCNRLNLDRILNKPNPLMSWKELVYQHYVYKFCTGNAFMRAAMPDTLSPDALKCNWCDNFWELPANLVQIKPVEYSYGVPLYGIAEKDEIIKGYTLDTGSYSGLTIPHYQIWHDRDGLPEILSGANFLKSKSRLYSVLKPISNLIAVYEARNVIYVKRGGLGFIVSQVRDAAGTRALEPEEKREIREDFNAEYGLGPGQFPYGISSLPLTFVRTNLSIQELMPFEETLEDAIKIAGAYGIPADLVPRKDKSTYDNQLGAQKDVYTGVIIPEAQQFCKGLTDFLGLQEKGFYIDCNFDSVDCLQKGLKESEEVKKLVYERCKQQFMDGLISINDWRSQIQESALEGEVYNKVKFEMTPEEIEKIESVISNKHPSKGEEDDRNNEEPSVPNEGDGRQ